MIYVIKHGQTDLNKERKMQGRMGLPLNEFGIEQAKALKVELQNIDFDFVFSSPQEQYKLCLLLKKKVQKSIRMMREEICLYLKRGKAHNIVEIEWRKS